MKTHQKPPPCTEIYLYHELASAIGLIPAIVLDVIRRRYDLARNYPDVRNYGIFYDRKYWARLHAADIFQALAGSVTLKGVNATLNNLVSRELIEMRTDPKDERITYITFSSAFNRYNSGFFDLPAHVY